MAINGPFVSSNQVASSVPFDNTTGHSFAATDVQAALEELRTHTVYDSTTTSTTAAGTLVLNNLSSNVQFLTGSAIGFSVQLPDATTLNTPGLTPFYQILNTSNKTVTIKDGSGATLFTLGQTSVGLCYLQLNSTAAGTWVYYQAYNATATGIVSYNVVSSTAFASSAAVDTLITGMSVVPVPGTYAVWANFQITGTGSGQQEDTTVYNGATPIVDSKRSNLSTAGLHIFSSSTQTISQFNGTNACALYINPNGNSFTVGARSLLLIRLGT